MVGQFRLLTVGILLVSIIHTGSGAKGAANGWLADTLESSSTGDTHATAKGDHLDVNGSRSRKAGGRPAAEKGDGTGSVGCGAMVQCSAPRPAPEPKTLGEYLTARDGSVPLRYLFRQNRPWPLPPPEILPPTPAAEPAAPGRVVTANEVERFLPVQGVVHSEPRGWAVVGVPANFWVVVAPATVDGELFGTPVQVRFTPTGYLWEYGDGEAAQTDTPGASWTMLGQEELTETPTGHVYMQRGKATVSVRVGYTAEYRVGDGDWIGVQGEVVAPAPPTQMLLVTESTVLTAAP